MSMKIDESFLTKYSSEDLYRSDKYYFEGLPYIKTYIIEKDYDLIRKFVEKGINQFTTRDFWANSDFEKSHVDKIISDCGSRRLLIKKSLCDADSIVKEDPIYNMSKDSKNQCVIAKLGTIAGCDNYEKAFREVIKAAEVEEHWEIIQLHDPSKVNRTQKRIGSDKTGKNFLIITCGSGLTGISVPKFCKLVFEDEVSSPIVVFQSDGRLLRALRDSLTKEVLKKEVQVYFNSKEIAFKVLYEVAVEDSKVSGKPVKDCFIDWQKVMRLSIFNEEGIIEEVDINDSWEEINRKVQEDIASAKNIDCYCSLTMEDFESYNIYLNESFNQKIQRPPKVAATSEVYSGKETGLSGIAKGRKGKKASNNSKEENSFIVSLGARLQYFIRMSYEDFGYEDFVSAVRDNMELFTELTKITEDMFEWCLKEKKFDIDRLNLVYSVCRINPNAIPNSYTGSIRIVPPQLYTEF